MFTLKLILYGVSLLNLRIRSKKMINFFCQILGVPLPSSGTTEYYILFVFACAIVLAFAVALVRFLLAPIDIASRLKR